MPVEQRTWEMCNTHLRNMLVGNDTYYFERVPCWKRRKGYIEYMNYVRYILNRNDSINSLAQFLTYTNTNARNNICQFLFCITIIFVCFIGYFIIYITAIRCLDNPCD